MLKLIGSILSFIYVIVLLIIIFCTDILEKNEKLTLNELGDFLAGAFSPLAFSWLVIGYLTQGKELKLNRQMLELQAEELKNNNKALLLQAKELENAVQAQNDMVKQGKEQIAFERVKFDEEKEKERIRNSPPELEVTFDNIENTNQYICYIQNTGGPAVNLKILVQYNNRCFKRGESKGKRNLGINPWSQELKSLTAEQYKTTIFKSSADFNIISGTVLTAEVLFQEEMTGLNQNSIIDFNINEDLTISQIE